MIWEQQKLIIGYEKKVDKNHNAKILLVNLDVPAPTNRKVIADGKAPADGNVWVLVDKKALALAGKDISALVDQDALTIVNQNVLIDRKIPVPANGNASVLADQNTPLPTNGEAPADGKILANQSILVLVNREILVD